MNEGVIDGSIKQIRTCGGVESRTIEQQTRNKHRDIFVSDNNDTAKGIVRLKDKGQIVLICGHIPLERQEAFYFGILDTIKEDFFEKNNSVPSAIKELIHTEDIFKSRVVSYIKKKLESAVENERTSLQIDISFFLFLLGIKEDFGMFNALKQSNSTTDKMDDRDFEKIDELFDRLAGHLTQHSSNLEIELDRYLQLCEVVNKIAAVHAVNFRDRLVTARLAEMTDSKIQNLLSTITDIPTEYKNELINLRGRFMVGYSYRQEIRGTAREEIQSEVDAIHAKMKEGLALCESVWFGRDGRSETAVKRAFAVNWAYTDLMGIKKMEEYGIEITPDIEEKRKISKSNLSRVYWQTLGMEKESNGEEVARNFIVQLSDKKQQSRLRIEIIYDLLDHSISPETVFELLTGLIGSDGKEPSQNPIEIQKQDNYFYVEYQIKIIDTLLEQVLESDYSDMQGKMNLIDRTVAYIRSNQKQSVSVLSFSRIYLTIATYLANVCDEKTDTNTREKLYSHYHYFLSLSNGAISKELESKSNAVLRKIGLIAWQDFGIPTTPDDSILINAGKNQIKNYAGHFYYETLIDIGKMVTQTANNRGLSEESMTVIKQDISDFMAQRIFGGVCDISIIPDCPQCKLGTPNAINCASCQKKRGVETYIVMLDELGYHIEFRYPSNAQAIFHGIISAGEAEIKEHISAILQTHLNVVREQQAITEAASARERERQLAYFDLATGLPNRAKLEDDLMNLRADDGTIVVFSVMDDEKMHDRKKRAGIERWITHGLQANQEKIGDGYRLGENLFAIVVPGNKSKEEVNTQVNSLSEIFSQGTDNHVNLSFYKGATRTTPKYALEEAEDAHAAARSTQSPKILYFEKEHLDRKRRQEGISRLVQEALDNPEDSDCEILPFYQLKVDLNNPEKIECEALLRCQDRRTGYLYNTADVVECIEGDFGTSTRTTIMMIRKIAQHMEKEKRLHVSINMDTYSWLSEEVLHVLVDELPRFLSPKRISLEVLEREKLTDEMRETIGKLQKLGYQIEIDDFGQGNSNYDRAVELNANRLKIDGKFVGMLENSETRSKGEAIIRGIISLAKDLSMGVLAEGVETKETCKLLQGLEITSFQGWFFTKAVPFEKLGDAIDQVQRRLQEIGGGIQEKLI